jgi:capsular polysaccharide biosynthesis protein
MDLARHLKVLWRYRLIVAVGVLLGIALAILAAFHVPSFERRGSELWSVQSDTMVTQPGFPWGRVTLPPQATAPIPGTEESTAPRDQGLEFADPGRFSSLAMLYSVLAVSDRVRERLPERVAPEQVQAQAYDATGNGSTFLPIIRLTTQAESAEKARRLNLQAQEGLKELIEEEQRDNDIEPNQRVRLTSLNAPSRPLLLSGPSMTPSLLALMLCILGAVALAHVLEALRPRYAPGDADAFSGIAAFDPPVADFPDDDGVVDGYDRRTGHVTDRVTQ